MHMINAHVKYVRWRGTTVKVIRAAETWNLYMCISVLKLIVEKRSRNTDKQHILGPGLG